MCCRKRWWAGVCEWMMSSGRLTQPSSSTTLYRRHHHVSENDMSVVTHQAPVEAARWLLHAVLQWCVVRTSCSVIESNESMCVRIVIAKSARVCMSVPAYTATLQLPQLTFQSKEYCWFSLTSYFVVFELVEMERFDTVSEAKFDFVCRELLLVITKTVINCNVKYFLVFSRYGEWLAIFYRECGHVVDSFETTCVRFLWVCEWKHFWNQWIFGKVTSKRVVVSCTLPAWPTHLLKDEESARDNHVLACNFAKYSPIKKIFFHSDSAINFS